MDFYLHKNCRVSFSTKKDSNMAYHLPISTADVAKNRQNFARKKKLSLSNTLFMDQIHSNFVLEADKKVLQQCDGLITNDKTLHLAVMVADCIPIFIYDPKNEAVAALHAGRVGTFNLIAKNAVLAMQRSYGSDPENLFIHMGPSIKRCCYEVSQQMANIVTNNFSKEFVTNRFIDLPNINRSEFEKLGVKKENITIDSCCTQCNSDTFFSYRAQKDQSGRFIGVISFA